MNSSLIEGPPPGTSVPELRTETRSPRHNAGKVEIARRRRNTQWSGLIEPGMHRKQPTLHGLASRLCQPNSILLAIYCVALAAVMVLPVDADAGDLLDIGMDKWAHLALFGGLAALLQWNLGVGLRAMAIAFVATSFFAWAIEIVQGMLAHRSASMMDLAAGMLGAILGAATTNRVLRFERPERIIGIGVAVLGAIIGAIFTMADVIGVGDASGRFGALQAGGLSLGLLIAAGGLRVFLVGVQAGDRGNVDGSRGKLARER